MLKAIVQVVLTFVSPLLLSQALDSLYQTGALQRPPVTLTDILILCLFCVLGGTLGTIWVLLRPTLNSLPWTFLWWAFYFLLGGTMGFADAGDAGSGITRDEAWFKESRYVIAGLISFGFFLVAMTACFVSFLKSRFRQ